MPRPAPNRLVCVRCGLPESDGRHHHGSVDEAFSEAHAFASAESPATVTLGRRALGFVVYSLIVNAIVVAVYTPFNLFVGLSASQALTWDVGVLPFGFAFNAAMLAVVPRIFALMQRWRLMA